MSSEPPPVARLQIAPHVSHALRCQAQEAARREACGVVYGVCEAHLVRVVAIDTLPNRASTPSVAFCMEAQDVIAARRPGLRRVGFWHTHTDLATPSAADRRVHEQFLRVIPGRVRPERLMLVVAPFGGLSAHWFGEAGWSPLVIADASDLPPEVQPIRED